MNDLNSVLVEGNIVAEPMFKTTPKGTAVCTFSVASNRYFERDKEIENEVYQEQ